MPELKKERLVFFLVLALAVVISGFFLISGDGITGSVIVADQLDDNVVSGDFNKIAIKEDIKNSNQVSSKSLDNEGLSISQGCSNSCNPNEEFYCVEMFDSGNDGWNGNLLTIGNSVYGSYFNSGASAFESHCSECGTYPVTCGNGTDQNEVSWKLFHDNFDLVLNGGAPYNGVLRVPGSCKGDCDQENSLWISDPSSTYPVFYDTSVPISSFEFKVDGTNVDINYLSHNIPNFIVTYSVDTIYGNSPSGALIPIGTDFLLDFGLSSSNVDGITDLIFYDEFNNLISSFNYDDGICPPVCGSLTDNAKLENDVYSSGTCFTINEPNIVLDCNGYSIYFGSGTDPSVSGVKNPGFSGVTVKNCNIIDQEPSANINYGISFGSGANGGIIRDNSIITTNGYGIHLDYNNDNLLVNNDIISVNNLEIYDNSGSTNKNNIEYNNIFGKIEWTDDSAGGFLMDLTLDGDIGFSFNNPTISNNNIELNPNSFSTGNIDSVSDLEFYNVMGLTTPFPQRNGLPCLSGCSPVTNIGSNNYKFTADGFSNYGIADNNPPQLSNFILIPNAILTNNDAVAYVDYLDLENQTGTIYFQWYVNGVNVYNQTRNNILNGTMGVISNLSSTNFSKNDQINVSVHASDGIINSIPIWSGILIVQDTPPNITSAILNSTDHPLNLTNANLTTYWDFFDLDGDNITNRNISWYKDSIIQPGLSNLDTINSSETQKGGVWQFNISVETNTSWSDWYSSNLLTIENTPPVLNNMLLTPGVVYTNDNLIATVDYDDIDNDPGIVNFFWHVNSVYQYNTTTAGVTAGSSVQSIFNSMYYSKGDLITVTVDSSDGIDDSNIPSSTITVQDTLPVITYAILNSTDHPFNLSDANLTAYWDFSDEDNDLQQNVQIKWYKDGNYLIIFDNQSSINSLTTNAGDIWRFNVSVQTGGVWSSWLMSNELIIQSSVPVLNSVTLSNDDLNNRTTGNFSLSESFSSNDGGSISQREIFWYKDNIIQTNLENLTNVSSGNTSKSDVWNASMRIKVNGLWSNWLSSNSLVIQNTNPILTPIQFSPEVVYTNTDLTALVNYSDVDGDEANISFLWTINDVVNYGSPTSLTNWEINVNSGSIVSNILTSGNFSKNDTIDLFVTVNGTSVSVNSYGLIINDSSPIMNSAILNSTDHPFNLSNANLTANYVFNDLDNDPQQNVQIKWYKNGNYLIIFDNQSSINSLTTNEGDIWRFNVSVQTDGVWSSWLMSNELVINNQLPALISINFNASSENNYTNDDLTCSIVGYDPDQSQSLTAIWVLFRDNLLFSNGSSNLINNIELELFELDGSFTNVGEEWVCSVVLSDGITVTNEINRTITIRSPNCGDVISQENVIIELTQDINTTGNESCFIITGNKVVMITGDHLTTAQAIAKQLGIVGKALTGQQLEKIKNLGKEIKDIGICARVKPEHKLRIVKTLQKKGYVVAMTGDGVNDAPALKKADIGVSMGISGTDVAKEAADMILTDDNFTSIVNAVEEGRGIFDNIRKFVNYLLSSNLGEIVVILLASLFGMPLPLTAIQILWINLVTDGLPAIALSLDPHEKDIMKRKPRPAKESILSKELKGDIFLIGTLMGIVTLGLFWAYLNNNQSLAKAQTIVFCSLVLFEIVRIQMIRGKYHLGIFSNKWLILAVVGSLSLQMVVVYGPLSSVFGTVPLTIFDWGVLTAAAAGLYLINKGYHFFKK